MRSRAVSSISAVILVALVAACGSDPATTSPSSETRQTAPSTSAKVTTTTSSTPPTTTTASVPPTEPPGPDQLGIDTSASRPLKVVLDDSVEVVVVGWNDSSTGDERDDAIQKGPGSEFVVLATEVETAYADVFAERFSQGESPEAIIADVLANPMSGFSPSVRSMNSFVFTPERGPALLFQDLSVVFPYVDDQRTAGRGTDVLAVRSIEVIDGQVTLYVYSGYYP